MPAQKWCTSRCFIGCPLKLGEPAFALCCCLLKIMENTSCPLNSGEQTSVFTQLSINHNEKHVFDGLSAQNLWKGTRFDMFSLKPDNRGLTNMLLALGRRNAKASLNTPSTRIESPSARPRSFASPRLLAHSHETKRFPGWTQPPLTLIIP